MRVRGISKGDVAAASANGSTKILSGAATAVSLLQALSTERGQLMFGQVAAQSRTHNQLAALHRRIDAYPQDPTQVWNRAVEEDRRQRAIDNAPPRQLLDAIEAQARLSSAPVPARRRLLDYIEATKW